MNEASNELRKFVAENADVDSSSLTTSCIHKLDISKALTKRIRGCISSEDPVDISLGLFVFRSLLENNKPNVFGNDFYKFLINILDKLRENESSNVSYQALELYVWLRDNYPNYQNIMRQNLIASDLGLRRISLQNYETFAKDKEVSGLIAFSKDNYAAEKSMNSTLFYELRDLSLDKIGKLTGKSFCKNRLKEPYDGTTVSWYDWSDFFEWWENENTNYT